MLCGYAMIMTYGAPDSIKISSLLYPFFDSIVMQIYFILHYR
jgi:hypothetical protein